MYRIIPVVKYRLELYLLLNLATRQGRTFWSMQMAQRAMQREIQQDNTTNEKEVLSNDTPGSSKNGKKTRASRTKCAKCYLPGVEKLRL